MPEIKLGSSKNMKNINLGSKEIEEVRLGSVLVWQNNLVPQIVLTTPENGEYGDLNFPIGVTVASNVDIVFSIRDLDPLDTVVSYSVSGPPGFTDIPTTPISPPANPVEGLTFTIPDTLFPTSGEPTTNNVFTVRVTDQRNKFGEYTITVIGVSVPPPTIRVTQEFGEYKHLTSSNPRSKTAIWAITQPQETIDNFYTPQYSIDNINWVDLPSTTSTSIPSIVELSTSTNCGGSSTVTVYCRSVKTGETTAVGNSAPSTLKITAPPATFPLSTPNGCAYGDYYSFENGFPRFFSQPRSCNGGIPNAGNSNVSGTVHLNAGYNLDYTGTELPKGFIDGNQAVTTVLGGSYRISIEGKYTVPANSGDVIQVGCTGGDYRITNTYAGQSGLIYLYNFVKITPNMTALNGVLLPAATLPSFFERPLTYQHPDFTYETYMNTSPTNVVVTMKNPGTYGNNTVSITANGEGISRTPQFVRGNWRMLDGSKRIAQGTCNRVQEQNRFKVT